MTLWIENLQRLVALVEKRQADHVHPEAIIAELVRDHGARYRDLNTYRLRLAGVEATSEAAATYLLHSWVRAARKKLPTDDGFNEYGSGPVPIEPREAP